MNTADEYVLSCYQDVAEIDAERGVFLVQHRASKSFFVKKLLTVYNLEIYQYLQRYPVPHMPRIAALTEKDGVLILIEEYCAGSTLQQLLDSTGVLPEEQVTAITVQLCSILQNLHECTPPIIHRDIKPSNIILSPDNVVYLLDMNAAKRQQSRQPRDTKLIGTAGYAAPEQYGFGSSDVRTDLYAVGVLMNVLLTGALPAEKRASGRLRPIIETCMQLDPAKRYSSAAQLSAAVSGTPADSRAADSWLPPGFRTRTPLHMVLAVLGYVCIFYISLTLTIKQNSLFLLWVNRICCTLGFLAAVLFSCDYRGIRQPFHLDRIRQPLLRFVVIAAIDFFLFVGFIVIAAIFENVSI